MIHKRDAPSFQRKTSLDEPVDGLSLIFNDFYGPMLTARVHWGEAAFQLFENITFFAVCGI
jgi:hypothetical protein